MERIAELRQKQSAVVASIEQIMAKPRAEKRGLNTEESAAYDRAYEDMSGLTKAIQAEEVLEARAKADAEAARKNDSEAEKRKGDSGDSAGVERRAFDKWVRNGSGVDFDPEERAALRESQQRALSAGTVAAGGYTVPEGFESRIVEAILAYGGVIDAIIACGGEVLKTDGGNPIPWPTLNDTSSGAQLNENTDATTDTALDTAFGAVTLGGYQFTSNLIKVSNWLLQDTGVDLEAILIRLIGTDRLGRIYNSKLTTGTGSSTPQGIVVGSTLGVTAAGAAAITNAELINLIHSVNRGYRAKARFMFADSTLKYLLKLVDGNSYPLFQPSYRDAAPATINGYPFTINDDMAAIATAQKSVLFGDFSYHKVRLVNGIAVKRLVERYAEANITAFVAFQRMDAKYIDASGGAVKHLIQA